VAGHITKRSIPNLSGRQAAQGFRPSGLIPKRVISLRLKASHNKENIGSLNFWQSPGHRSPKDVPQKNKNKKSAQTAEILDMTGF
jgi:hypothetical protein